MTTTLLTIDEYAALPEQYDEHGNQLKDELIKGELILSPRASWTHAEIVERVVEALKPLKRWGCRLIGEGALPIFEGLVPVNVLRLGTRLGIAFPFVSP